MTEKTTAISKRILPVPMEAWRLWILIVIVIFHECSPLSFIKMSSFLFYFYTTLQLLSSNFFVHDDVHTIVHCYMKKINAFYDVRSLTARHIANKMRRTTNVFFKANTHFLYFIRDLTFVDQIPFPSYLSESFPN